MADSINRRQALGAIAVGGAALSAVSSVSAVEGGGKLNGRIKQSVSRWCYGGTWPDFKEFCKACADIGLQGVDLVGEDEAKVMKEFGLVPSMFTPGAGSIPDACNDPKLHDKLLKQFEENIPKAARYGAPNVITFSGNRKGMNDYDGMRHCADIINKAVKIAENEGVVICMELLNSKVNHKDYMCDHTDWGVTLVKMVNHPNFKLLNDLYHMQIMEGDIIRNIQDHHACFNHYHTGGVPGRNDLDETQEMYYPAIMRAIVDTGYTGFVAHEFVPRAQDKEGAFKALQQAVTLCDV
ncbi:MAG: TIM barrel protein [bacterium]|nr:TIM barrel protein [bacterium]